MDFVSQFLADNPQIVTIYEVVRGIVIVLDGVFLVIAIYAIAKLLPYRAHFVYDPRKWQKHVRAKKAPAVKTPVVTAAWEKVRTKLRDGSVDSIRLAVIEADGATDEVLKRMGLAGETFADRLGRVDAERHPSVEKVWDAHRLRNNLVHTPDFHVAPAKAEEAVGAYEAFLKDMKAL